MENVGVRESLLRIAIGLVALAWVARSRRWGMGSTLLAAFGAMKVAEGITRYCPLNAALGVTSVEDDGEKTVLRLGPLEYKRVPRRPRVRTLWGVRPDLDGDDPSLRSAAGIGGAAWTDQTEEN